MIHDQHGFSVSIRNGLNGAIAPEYDSENSRTSRSIEAAADATLCPQITIHKNFNWHGADGLYVAIRYGSRPYQLKVWVPKPAMSILNEEDNCSFQIPGKNIWDPATKKPIGCEYRIADLDVSLLQQIEVESLWLLGSYVHYTYRTFFISSQGNKTFQLGLSIDTILSSETQCLHSDR